MNLKSLSRTDHGIRDAAQNRGRTVSWPGFGFRHHETYSVAGRYSSTALRLDLSKAIVIPRRFFLETTIIGAGIPTVKV